MVDSISNWTSGSILKSQAQQNNAAQQATGRGTFAQAAQGAAKAARSVFEQMTQTIDQPENKALVKPAGGNSLRVADAPPADASLPRGSLIDILA